MQGAQGGHASIMERPGHLFCLLDEILVLDVQADLQAHLTVGKHGWCQVP